MKAKTRRRLGQYGKLIRGECVWSQQSQSSRQAFLSAFGDLPFRQAGGLSQQFTNPLSAAFGVKPVFGEGPRGQRREARWNRQMEAVEQDQGPLGSYIRQAQDYLPQVFGQAQDAGQRIASLAPGLFDQLRGQVEQSLGQLGGIQEGAAGNVAAAQSALGQAGEAVNQAFSPIQNQALYQNALQNTLQGVRGGAAARGLLDAGGTQQREETLGRDLAAQYAQQAFGNQQAALAGQQQALGGVGGALGQQAGLLPVGAQLSGMLQQALPGLQEALAAGYQMPMDALQGVFQQIAAAQNPQLALMGLTAPQLGTFSSGHGYGGIFG